jgi:adenylate cyclase class IV
VSREVELKGIVDDPGAVLAALRADGAEPMFEGRLHDLRYDTVDRTLAARDCVLRLRVYENAEGITAGLDWKGPTGYEDGYKVRQELTTGVTDPAALKRMLEDLGYIVTREIDRRIVQFRCRGAVVRIEHYPRMDVLAEVEGEPEAIEAAIAVTGIPRERFTTGRLPDFARAFELRTGERAAVSDDELRGVYRYSIADA